MDLGNWESLDILHLVSSVILGALVGNISVTLCLDNKSVRGIALFISWVVYISIITLKFLQ